MKVEVEVDLNDFATLELIDELEERLDSHDKSEIFDFCRKSLGIEHSIPQNTLLDAIKLELIEKNIHKFTLDELEVFFKSK